MYDHHVYFENSWYTVLPQGACLELASSFLNVEFVMLYPVVIGMFYSLVK